MDREQLRKLVESLPEGAIEAAGGALTHLQVWPLQPPPGHTEMMRQRLEQMREWRRSGIGAGWRGVGGGGGSSHPGGFERYSSSRVEDGACVVEQRFIHNGREVAVIERVALEDGGHLVYADEVTGPDDRTEKRELRFKAGPSDL
jgi:hypothetical protein